MNRHEALHIAAALNEAIWLRDNADALDKEKLYEAIELLGSYEVFSNRQITAITNGLVSLSVVSSLNDKVNKTGGNLNPGTLELLRTILYARAENKADRKMIEDAVSSGTSQGMVAKLTGVSQSLISKIMNGGKNGKSR